MRSAKAVNRSGYVSVKIYKTIGMGARIYAKDSDYSDAVYSGGVDGLSTKARLV